MEREISVLKLLTYGINFKSECDPNITFFLLTQTRADRLRLGQKCDPQTCVFYLSPTHIWDRGNSLRIFRSGQKEILFDINDREKLRYISLNYLRLLIVSSYYIFYKFYS